MASKLYIMFSPVLAVLSVIVGDTVNAQHIMQNRIVLKQKGR